VVLCEWQIGARALRLRVAELSNLERHQANASSRRREEEPCKNGSPL
jgi:hypothetical protein